MNSRLATKNPVISLVNLGNSQRLRAMYAYVAEALANNLLHPDLTSATLDVDIRKSGKTAGLEHHLMKESAPLFIGLQIHV